jgi:Phage integrase family
MLFGGGSVADTNNTSTMLLHELAALDMAHRLQLATALRRLAETFAEVGDGKTAAHTLGVLAHLLDPASRVPK